jgi:hypothetical protein
LLAPKRADGFQDIGVGQRDIEQNDVEPAGRRQAQGGGCGSRFACGLEVVRRIQQLLEPGANQGVIVDDQYARLAARQGGTFALRHGFPPFTHHGSPRL